MKFKSSRFAGAAEAAAMVLRYSKLDSMRFFVVVFRFSQTSFVHSVKAEKLCRKNHSVASFGSQKSFSSSSKVHTTAKNVIKRNAIKEGTKSAISRKNPKTAFLPVSENVQFI